MFSPKISTWKMLSEAFKKECEEEMSQIRCTITMEQEIKDTCKIEKLSNNIVNILNRAISRPDWKHGSALQTSEMREVRGGMDYKGSWKFKL